MWIWDNEWLVWIWDNEWLVWIEISSDECKFEILSDECEFEISRDDCKFEITWIWKLKWPDQQQKYEVFYNKELNVHPKIASFVD